MHTTVTKQALTLDHLGNVPASYEHEWRLAESRDPILLPCSIFKWYHVRREGQPVPEAMDAEARALLIAAVVQGDWDMQYGLNFAMLHVSTAHAILVTGVWRGHNELWERIYVKALATNGPFEPTDRTGLDSPAACVWELAVICHERMAWHQYLFSDRANLDKLDWLENTYSGPA